MNRTQKNTWFALAEYLLSLVILAYYFIRLFWIPRLERWGIVHFWPVLASVLVLVLFFTCRKKQSPAEPESDERDQQIKQRAVIVSFVSIWLLLFLTVVISAVLFGWAGPIPVCILPPLFVGIFLLSMIVYCMAVLIQYSKGGAL